MQFMIPGDDCEAALNAGDPILFSPGHIRESGDVWDISFDDYPYSYHEKKFEFRPLPAHTTFSMPSLVPKNFRREDSKIAPLKEIPPRPTKIILSENLATRLVEESSDIPTPTEKNQLLSPAEFLLAIHPDGNIAYVFLLTSSGSEPLDVRASQALYEAKFAPMSDENGESIAWGEAQFLWGADE